LFLTRSSETMHIYGNYFLNTPIPGDNGMVMQARENRPGVLPALSRWSYGRGGLST